MIPGSESAYTKQWGRRRLVAAFCPIAVDIRYLPAFLLLTHVEFRVNGVKVFAVQVIQHDPEAFAEPLEVDDLAGTEEADRVDDIRIIHHA